MTILGTIPDIRCLFGAPPQEEADFESSYLYKAAESAKSRGAWSAGISPKDPYQNVSQEMAYPLISRMGAETLPGSANRMQSTLACGSERERSFDEAITRVREYLRLPEDWDSYGGKPASDPAVDYAARLLSCLRGIPEIPLPFVTPISGGVYLEWSCEGRHLYLEIDQTSVLIVVRGGGQIVSSEEIALQVEDRSRGVESAIEPIRNFYEVAS